MLQDLFTALWFFLPAGLANMFPVFAAKLPVLKNWDYPMDFNLQFRGQRVLGSHKTIRGLITGVVIGIIIVGLQKELYLNWAPSLRSILAVNYTQINFVYLGALLGFGAIFGDAVKSFFKRQLNIPSGETWMFFDQIDYILGGIVFTYWYAPLSLEQYIYLTVLYFGLHMLTTVIGYLIGLKEKPF